MKEVTTKQPANDKNREKKAKKALRVKKRTGAEHSAAVALKKVVPPNTAASQTANELKPNISPTLSQASVDTLTTDKAARRETLTTEAKEAVVPQLAARPISEPEEDQLPDGFVASDGKLYQPLSNLNQWQKKHICGVVTWSGDIRETYTGERMRSISLIDPSLPNHEEPLKLTLFRPGRGESWLPNAETGNILLVENVKKDANFKNGPSLRGIGYKEDHRVLEYSPSTQTFRWGSKISWVHDGVNWNHGEMAANLHPQAFNPFVRPDQPMLDYFLALHSWFTSLPQQISVTAAPVAVQRPARPHMLLKDLIRGQFFDCTVEIINVSRSINQTVVYAVDYTANDLNYESDRHELGALNMVTTFVLYDSQHQYSEELEIGKYYALENVRMHTSGMGMECVMGSRGDQRRRFSKLYDTCPDEYLEALLKRKAEILGAQTVPKLAPGNSPDGEAEGLDVKEEDTSLDVEMIDLETNLGGSAEPEDTETMDEGEAGVRRCPSLSGDDVHPEVQEPIDIEAIYAAHSWIHRDHPPVPISVVESCGIVPVKFRVQGRVVDFAPRPSSAIRQAKENDGQPGMGWNLRLAVEDKAGDTLGVRIPLTKREIIFPSVDFDGEDWVEQVNDRFRYLGLDNADDAAEELDKRDLMGSKVGKGKEIDLHIESFQTPVRDRPGKYLRVYKLEDAYLYE